MIEFFVNKGVLSSFIILLYPISIFLLLRQFRKYLLIFEEELCYLCGDDRCKLNKSSYISERICNKCLKKENSFTKRDLIYLLSLTIIPLVVLFINAIMTIVFIILRLDIDFTFVIQLIIFFLLLSKKKILILKYA